MEDKKLIMSVTKKDFDISFFSGKGGGGQHRNRHMNCVRMKHRDSGAMATGQESREKQTNIRNAFLRCINTDTYKSWERIEIAKRMRNYTDIEKAVQEQMKDDKLKMEIKDADGNWVEISLEEWKVLKEMEDNAN